MKRAVAPILALAAGLAGCGGGDRESSRIGSGPLTIYASVPRHGISAVQGEAIFLGQRRALRDAGSRAGGRRIRLVRLSSTRVGDALWDPGTVKGNAERARRDPSAVAYLGELDYGASAISLPVTNRARLLQVSPAEGLTSLTRTPPGRPRAGPERYYPEGVRTFVRLVPSDLLLAEELLTLVRRRDLRSAVILHGEGIADRELTAVIANRLRRRAGEPALVEPLADDVDDARALVERVAATSPRVILHVGARTAATRATLAALADRLPAVPLLGSAALAAPGALGPAAPRQVRALTPILPARAQPPEGRRLLRSLGRERGSTVGPEALYGYESMRLALAAIERAGADRRAVAQAAVASGPRQTVLGRLAVGAGREVRPARLALMDLSGGRRTIEDVRAAGG